MKLVSDNRAQSVQVGVVLLFGFLVLALTIYQAEGVPEENKQVEFEHSQQVANEMVELYNAVFDTVVTGDPQTASITLGTEYNNRLYFIYPPPASGALQTTDSETLRIHNATAVTGDPTNQSFDNYWNNETRHYSKQAVTYEANYRELRGAATYRMEYGILAANYTNITQLQLAESHQPIVDGTEIEIVVFNGSLQSVDTDAQSVIPERTTESTELTVANDSNTGPITLELPTILNGSNWNTSRDDSILHDPYENGNVERVDYDGSENIANVTLNSSREYTLTIHKVDIGDASTEPAPTYLRNVSYDGTDATFEIRNEFNDKVDETQEVAVYNTTEITRNITVVGGRHTFQPMGGSTNECGVSIAEDIGSAESYENINITAPCK